MKLAYLDSSAFVKTIVDEPQSASLANWLGDWPDMASSMLLRAEAPRAVSRQDPSALRRVRETIELLYLIPVSESLLDAAGRLSPPAMRTLDAIHVAAALSLGSELGVFVTYDRRMFDAARRLGLPVASPA